MFDGRKTKTENDTLRDINKKAHTTAIIQIKKNIPKIHQYQLRLQRHEYSLLPAYPGILSRRRSDFDYSNNPLIINPHIIDVTAIDAKISKIISALGRLVGLCRNHALRYSFRSKAEVNCFLHPDSLPFS